MSAPPRILNGFAGPAGWEEGARLLGLGDDILGVEIDEKACTAAVAAGHRRLRADIRAVDPADFPEVTGFLCSSPCPTFSAAGKGTGRTTDYQLLLDAITHAGSGCGCSWAEIAAELAAMSDPRTALAAETIRFTLQLPGLEWLAFEQAPTVEYLFEDIAAELLSCDDGTDEGGYGPGWETAEVFFVDARHLGMPVRRRRVFLVARRHTALGGRGVAHPAYIDPWPAPTMAQALGWRSGHRVHTRGQRRPTGGNLFSCDGPAWCLTEKARSWQREADGLRLTAADAGLLQGFRRDYPWTGSRTGRFHQLADVVCPPVAAAVLGYVTGTPWVAPVRSHLEALYGGAGQLAASA